MWTRIACCCFSFCAPRHRDSSSSMDPSDPRLQVSAELMAKLTAPREQVTKFGDCLKGKFLPCRVIKVYDGDSVTIQFVFGDATYYHGMRLWGIDTPELRSNDPDEKLAAARARDYLSDRVLNKIVFVKFEGMEKYGRLLGHLYDCTNPQDEGKRSINAELINLGFAQHYTGGNKLPYALWAKKLFLAE
jgi:endonuclease YncB( thermonuclease family)